MPSAKTGKDYDTWKAMMDTIFREKPLRPDPRHRTEDERRQDEIMEVWPKVQAWEQEQEDRRTKGTPRDG
ncbi:MAG: hypothetical protein HY675_27190 [Chloroflexi bacterium]|nr:hypothetical protein [Chloroflexota bacterium]